MNRFNSKKTRFSPRAGRVLFTLMPLIGCAAAFAEDAPPATQPAAGNSLVVKGVDEQGGIRLTVGESRVVVTRNPSTTVDITQPDIVQGKLVSATDVLVTGKRPGISQLVIWDERGRSESITITVVADLDALRSELKKLLPKTNIDVSTANGAIVLRGRVPDVLAADHACDIAAPYGAKVLNFLEVAGGQQVTLQVRFAEVSRDATLNLGFNAFGQGGQTRFGSVNGPGGSPMGALSDPTKTASVDPSVAIFGAGKIGATAFEFFIQAMRDNNLLRVLAEPNLTVLSGKDASFLAGGEYPIPVPQSGGAGGGGTAITIEYKKFGVRLKFTPVILGDGKIRLHVVPEVSDLDYTHTVSFGGFQIPSLTERTADTTVELADGQTMALAGLLSNRVTSATNVTPLLGDIPILGALFRSVRYERSETELVVMVTPRIAGPMNPGQVPAMPGENWRFPTEGELFWARDLGGPVAQPMQSPDPNAPARFHGAYGFTPAPAPAEAASR